MNKNYTKYFTISSPLFNVATDLDLLKNCLNKNKLFNNVSFEKVDIIYKNNFTLNNVYVFKVNNCYFFKDGINTLFILFYFYLNKNITVDDIKKVNGYVILRD